jgi:hypothetical protein
VNWRTKTANAKYPRSAGSVVPFALPPNRLDYGLPLLLLAEALLLATPSIGFFGGVEREFVQLAIQLMSKHRGVKAGPFEIRPAEDSTAMIG